MLTAEFGTTTPNSGRISLVNRTTGARQTLVGGLPSGVNNLAGPPRPSGLSGLILRGHTVYLSIGTGDAMMNVGPGRESPNPNPSSPLFASVLELNLPGNYEDVTSEFTLSLANQATLASGAEAQLTNADGQTMTIRMVVDLPNSIPNPITGFPNNLRASNLFGVEIFQKKSLRRGRRFEFNLSGFAVRRHIQHVRYLSDAPESVVSDCRWTDYRACAGQYSSRRQSVARAAFVGLSVCAGHYGNSKR